MKLYIHHSNAIYPQPALGELKEDNIRESVNNRLVALEPTYEGIPRGILRRMGKAVRIGVGAALPLLKAEKPLSGVILGTANGGMEDCVRFFNQIIDYEEGNLTPTNFVQSTTNAIASQIGLMAANKGYNNTHVHAGLAFENALIDAMMLLTENPEDYYLLGGVDEISDYNYNIDLLGGWNKPELTSNKELFNSNTEGSIAGEGAAMFIASGEEQGALCQIEAMKTLAGDDPKEIQTFIGEFVSQHLGNDEPDLIISGESGDSREQTYYDTLENTLPNCPVSRYKHLTGELPTANALALWMGQQILEHQQLPQAMIKRGKPEKLNRILIYNAYHSSQHSLILLSGL